jgi:hypothetical protein
MTRADWKAILCRVERLGPRLLIRVRLLQHRHQPDRILLTTEALRLDGTAAELPVIGGTERTLDGCGPPRCRQEYARALHSVITSRGR